MLGLLGAVGLMTAAAAPAQAQSGPPVIASGHAAGMCIDIKGGTNEAVLWSCHGGSNQQLAFASGSYGQVRVNGMCLSARARGAPLIASGCANTPAQRWINTREGFLRNEQGYCADVERGGGQGSRVIAWECNSGMFGGLFGPPTNQRWAFARFVPASLVSSQARSLPIGRVIDLRSAGIAGVVAAGGGNVVAAGGGNVVAAGGGNVVAAGGGNLLVPMSGLIAGGR
jgi:hypothetical protein